MRLWLRPFLKSAVLVWIAALLFITSAVTIGRGLPRGAEVIYTTTFTRGLYTTDSINLLDVNRHLTATVTPRSSNAISPSWSPDGNRIAFVSDRSGSLSLYLMDADSSHVTATPTQLTSFGGTAWLPDGNRIIFRARIFGSPKAALYDIHSGESYVLNVTGTSDSPVLWSPDGGWLIYISYRDGNPRLYMVSPDCNSAPAGCKYNERQLLQSEYVRWPPTWSPDGKQLIFTGISHSDTDLFMVAVDCNSAPADCIRNEKRLTDNQVDDFAPAWSPDGKTLAFLSKRDGPTSIYLMDMPGESVRRLNDEDFNAVKLLWSPDSREILLASVQSGESILYMVDADTGVTHRLTKPGQSAVDPVWRP